MVRGEKPGRTTAEQRLVWHDSIVGEVQRHKRQSERADCTQSSNKYFQWPFWATHMCVMHTMYVASCIQRLNAWEQADTMIVPSGHAQCPKAVQLLVKLQPKDHPGHCRIMLDDTAMTGMVTVLT